MNGLLYSFIKGTSVLPEDFWSWWLLMKNVEFTYYSLVYDAKCKIEDLEVEELSETERGQGGFGHSGK